MQKLHPRTQSFLFLGIVAAAAIAAVIIVEYQANKPENYGPALLVSKMRAKTATTAAKAPKQTTSTATTVPLNHRY